MNLFFQNELVEIGSETKYTARQDYLRLELYQPYLLSSVSIHFWNYDGRLYSYNVITSLNGENYELICDNSTKKQGGWQTIRFALRPVQYVKIVFLGATVGNELRVSHFQAPARE